MKDFSEYRREWRKKNRPRLRVYQREWKRKKRYGLTPEAFEAMFAGQGHRCAACGTKDFIGHGPSVDHDHKTGAIRGVLCGRCNLAIGLLDDSPDKVAAILRYLKEGP